MHKRFGWGCRETAGAVVEDAVTMYPLALRGR